LHSSPNIAWVIKEDKLAGHVACVEDLTGTGCECALNSPSFNFQILVPDRN